MILDYEYKHCIDICKPDPVTNQPLLKPEEWAAYNDQETVETAQNVDQS